MDRLRDRKHRFDSFRYHPYAKPNEGYGQPQPPPPPPDHHQIPPPPPEHLPIPPPPPEHLQIPPPPPEHLQIPPPPPEQHHIPPPPPRPRRIVRHSEISERDIQNIINDLKEKGTFDKFRHKCLNDLESTDEYQKLHSNVSETILSYLSTLKWTATLNGQQARDTLRRRILENRGIERGIEGLLDDIVDPRVHTEFHSTVEEGIYIKLGIPLPSHLGPDNIDLVEMDEDNDESPPPPPGEDETHGDDSDATDMESEEESPAFEAIGLSPPHYMPMSPLTPPEMKYHEASQNDDEGQGFQNQGNKIEETESEEMEYDPETEWSAEAAAEANRLSENKNIESLPYSDNSKEPLTPIYNENSNSSLTLEPKSEFNVEEIKTEEKENKKLVNENDKFTENEECKEIKVEIKEEPSEDNSNEDLENLDDDALEQKLLLMKQMLLQLDAGSPQGEDEENADKVEGQESEVKLPEINISEKEEQTAQKKENKATNPTSPCENEDQKEMLKEMSPEGEMTSTNEEIDEMDREIQSISAEKEFDIKSNHSDSDFELRPYSPETDYEEMEHQNSAQSPKMSETIQSIKNSDVPIIPTTSQSESNLDVLPSAESVEKSPETPIPPSDHTELTSLQVPIIESPKIPEPEPEIKNKKIPEEKVRKGEKTENVKIKNVEKADKKVEGKKSKVREKKKSKVVELPVKRLTRRSSRNSMSEKSDKNVSDYEEEVRFLVPIPSLALKLQILKELCKMDPQSSFLT